jgi:hypothetical protein
MSITFLINYDLKKFPVINPCRLKLVCYLQINARQVQLLETGNLRSSPMKLSAHLQSKLSKKYEPSSMVNMQYKGNDLRFKTDEEGNPVLLFIGKALENGKIKGERYTRTLKRDANGVYIKDHWERKGKAS